jgi:hypothetical protein
MTDRKPISKNPFLLDPVPDGQYWYSDEDDESLLIKTFQNGKLHGPSYWHYGSGELWIEQQYSSGKLNGTTTYFNKDGSVLKRECWEDGLLSGGEHRIRRSLASYTKQGWVRGIALIIVPLVIYHLFNLLCEYDPTLLDRLPYTLGRILAVAAGAAIFATLLYALRLTVCYLKRFFVSLSKGRFKR